MDSDSETKLISLITQLVSPDDEADIQFWEPDSKFISDVIRIMDFVRSMDLDSQPKPESELMSLTTQAISLFNGLDLDSLPDPLSELISLLNGAGPVLELRLKLLINKTLRLEPEPEFLSVIYKICLLVSSMNPQWQKLISLCPQVEVRVGQDGHFVERRLQWNKSRTWMCLPQFWRKFEVTKAIKGEGGDVVSCFFCPGCKGQKHLRHELAPTEFKHPLHPRHFLRLVWFKTNDGGRKCYCCDEYLEEFIYCCLTCDIAINIACLEKQHMLSIDRPKQHEHMLSLFPRTSITCNVCALGDSTSPIYVCLPCDFVVHRTCIDLPRIIKISRHLHRISFAPSFNQGSLSCDLCGTEIDNDYGAYSCIKQDCSYAVHSRCATRNNVWDGEDLEGVPEDIEEEEAEPFVRISDGIIKHFGHQNHYLELGENTDIDHDEDKLCQACVAPIYFGNFYSCIECDFILHNECAYLPRKMYHFIHPHMLNLVAEHDSVINYYTDRCSACSHLCSSGFFYECSKESCKFRVHVNCAKISESLSHGSHAHPLYLTSEPGEQRECCACRVANSFYEYKTFNCSDCEFSLCFGCATIPQKVRYTDDEHLLTLSYGKNTSANAYWCEDCEREIDPKKGFYKCDKNCCVALHIECAIGRDIHMKPGSSWVFKSEKIDVVSNHSVSRPICSTCKQRCQQKIAHQMSGTMFCSVDCVRGRLLLE